MSQLVDQLLQTILSTDDQDRSFVPFRPEGGDKVICLVNNLGGLSELEMTSVTNEVSQKLRLKGLIVERLLSGTFMVSLPCLHLSQH
jgi:dihydroxyacetone kinase